MTANENEFEQSDLLGLATIYHIVLCKESRKKRREAKTGFGRDSRPVFALRGPASSVEPPEMREKKMDYLQSCKIG